MNTGSLKTSPQPSVESIEARFRRLADDWERATAHRSSMKAKGEHSAYREITSLGVDVVPLLLRDLKESERHWFIALATITGANPIPQSAAGNIPKMIEAWLQWGKEHSYCWRPSWNRYFRGLPREATPSRVRSKRYNCIGWAAGDDSNW